jgi:CubicO group peptidase (beta-lactamase class C family)
MAGDGNVYSSLADLARYDAALRAGELLSPELLALAFTPGTLDNGSAIEEDGDGYGFGWGIGETYVDHTGSWWGTSTYYLHYLDEAVTIIVLSNDETYDAYALADAIAAELRD